MLVLLFPLIFGTCVLAVSILLLLSGELKKFGGNFGKRPPKITELPIITPSGQIVNSVEDLDMHLEFLGTQMEEKQKELETSKTKLTSAEENLKKLTDTCNEVKKYYMKLKSEINKSEYECGELKGQIDDYTNRQQRLREEVNENVKYYTDLLSNIDSGTVSTNEDYEIVKKLPNGI